MSLQRLVDMRYLGQWRSLTVPVSGPVDLQEAVDRFHAEHERAYNYRRDDAPVEIYRLSLRAIGVTPKPELAKRGLTPDAPFAPIDERQVLFDEGDDRLATPVYHRDDLPPGASFDGPAVIDQLDSTTLVPPGTRATVDAWLNIRIDILEV
jgi:N-methylhydantoinase A